MLYYSFCRNNRSERPGTCATWKSARYFLYHGARALRGVRGTGGIGSHRPPAAAPPVQRHAGRTGFLHRRSNRRLRGPAVQPPTSTAGLPRVLGTAGRPPVELAGFAGNPEVPLVGTPGYGGVLFRVQSFPSCDVRLFARTLLVFQHPLVAGSAERLLHLFVILYDIFLRLGYVLYEFSEWESS